MISTLEIGLALSASLLVLAHVLAAQAKPKLKRVRIRARDAGSRRRANA